MLLTTKVIIANVVFAVTAGGCVDGFKGSNIEIDFRNRTASSEAFPVQARYGAAPAAGELPQNVQLTLYAVPNPAMPTALVALTSFEIHRLVEPNSPCFIDTGEHVPHPGIHITQYANKIAEDTGITDIAHPPANATEDQKIRMATALQREENIVKLGVDLPDSAGKVGMRAVTSASDAVYPPVAPDCSAPAAGQGAMIPPPNCSDDASNQRRLQVCEDAWAAHPDLWEGTDRVLTLPLNGTTHGFVDGVNPVNLAPVDGAGWFLPMPLVNIASFAIFYKADGDTSSGPGTRLVTSVAMSKPTRGVTHITLAGAPLVMGDPPLIALMSIFNNLDDDSVNF